jgi:hypothetical protein
VTIAEGSQSVRINGLPAARLKSTLVCGAHVKSASPDVFIGGPTEQTDFVFDLEGWLHTGLELLGLGALIGAGVLAAAAGAGALAVFGAVRIPTMLTAESGDVDRLGSAVRGG